MTFLPIVGRELRVASRRRGTYLGRMAIAIGALVAGGWIFLAMHRAPPQTLGKGLFVTLAIISLIYAAIGFRTTADCLSEEKRDGTLGLLFLTDLRGYDVVLGKLFASSLGSAYGMLAIFPIMAIPILLGGVTYAEFWRIVLTCLNVLFLSLSIGMFASAVCRDERKALTLSFGLVIFTIIFSPLLGWFIAEGKPHQFKELFYMPCPLTACTLAFEGPFKAKAEYFWGSTIITHGYGWLLLSLACLIVPRSWQDKSPSARAQKMEQNLIGDAARRKIFRTDLLDLNPFCWLAARNHFKTRTVWGTLFILAVFWLWGALANKNDWFNVFTYVLTMIVLHTLLKFWLAMEASRHFVEDRRSGAMELLLSTPLSVEEILHGQRLALLRQFGGPVFVVLLADFAFLFLGLDDINGKSDEIAWVITWLAGVMIFIMDLFTLSWVSMWTGCTMKKVNRAAGAATSRILALPWIAFAMICILAGVLSLSSLFRKLFNFFDGSLIPVFWFGLCAANNFFWMNQAKHNLRERFREIATQRFGQARSFWASLFRFDDKQTT